MLNVKQESCEYQRFKSISVTNSEIDLRYTDEADALTTRPCADTCLFDVKFQKPMISLEHISFGKDVVEIQFTKMLIVPSHTV